MTRRYRGQPHPFRFLLSILRESWPRVFGANKVRTVYKRTPEEEEARAERFRVSMLEVAFWNKCMADLRLEEAQRREKERTK